MTINVPLTDGHGLRFTPQDDGTVHVEQTQDTTTRTPPTTIDVGYIAAASIPDVKNFFDSI